MAIKSITFLSIILFLITIKNIYSLDEEEEEEIHYFNFDLSDPDIKYEEGAEKIENIVTNKTNILLPLTKLIKEGYYINGWTPDFIYGYKPGGSFSTKEKNITFFPIFEKKNEQIYFIFQYIVEYNGVITDISKDLKPHIERENALIEITLNGYSNSNASHHGWTDGTNIFYSSDCMVMPNRNVTLYAVFHDLHKLYYSHGDVDGIVGNPDPPLVYPAGTTIDLAESSRLARKGYKIIGWHCDYDGKNYNIFYPYVLPNADVIMYAIWDPILYTLVFKTGVSAIPNIRIQAKTKESVFVPNLEEKREGYIFSGWIINGIQYNAGDEYIVEGQMPGLGMSISAIWIKS